MTTLLTINTGSTSVKLALFALEGGGAPTERARERHDGGEFDPREILNALAAKVAEPPKMIVHRIVHGGTRFSQPTLVNSEVLAAIEALTPLAPLHNPTALRASWLCSTPPILRSCPGLPPNTHCRSPLGWPTECAATDSMDLRMNRSGASGVRCIRVCPPEDALSRCNSAVAVRLPRSSAAARWTPPWDSRRSRVWSWPRAAATWIQRCFLILSVSSH